MCSEAKVDYLPEETVLKAAGATEQEIRDHREADRQRQKAWVNRKRAKATAGVWTPRKRYRKAAWQYAVALNNQIHKTTGYTILHWRVKEKVSERSQWWKWPLLSISPDLGSDELACHNCLQNYHFSNLDTFPDNGHGVLDDAKLAIGHAEMWPLLALTMIAHNVPHGPFNEDARYRTLTSVVLEFVDNTDDPEESPLFMSFMDRAILALGWKSRCGDTDIYSQVLAQFKEEPPFRVKRRQDKLQQVLGSCKQGHPHHATVAFLGVWIGALCFAAWIGNTGQACKN